MIYALMHPTFRRLNLYADRELSEPATRRMAEHLSRCAACRATVRSIHELDRSAQMSAPAGPLSPLVPAILARRKRGEEIILPVDEADRRGGRRPRLGAVAAAVVVLIAVSAVLSVLSAPRVEAAGSELRFFPERPRAGARIAVVYEPGSRFSGLDTLVLRARMRDPRDVTYNRGMRHVRVSRLVRGADGAFYGGFRLPDSVVYASFALEDLEATDIDHNLLRLWDLEVHGADGRPLFAALQQHYHDLHGRNWDALSHVGRRMTELYPEHPAGWGSLMAVESQIIAPEAKDSASAAYEARRGWLHASLAPRARLPADVIAGMGSYGTESVPRSYWPERLRREHPLHWLAVADRQQEARDRHRAGGSPAEYLSAVESLWAEIAPVAGADHARWFINPVLVAGQAKDAGAFLRWTERVLRHGDLDPSMRLGYVSPLVRWPEHRDRGMQMLRDLLGEWRAPDDAMRPLTSTREEFVREMSGWRRAAWVELGDALVDGGERDAGLAALDSATAAGWDTRVFERAARVRWTAGDAAGALREYSRLATDPGTQSYADSARAGRGADFDERRWEALLREAEARMRTESLRDASVRLLPRRIRVTDAAGAARELTGLTQGKVTVIAYWSPMCAASIRELSQLVKLQEWLKDRELKLVLLTGSAPSRDTERLLKQAGITFASYHDTFGEGRDALNQFSTPAYWVLDSTGAVVFDHTPLSSVRRQVAALMTVGGTPQEP